FIGETTTLRRVATFHPVALPGGDTAVHQPWRTALALLLGSFGATAPIDQLSLFANIPAGEIAGVRQQLASGLNAPLARGVGRYFDAFGALALARANSQYDGQVAFELNVAADPKEKGAYECAVTTSASLIDIDLRPVVRAAVGDLLSGVPPSIVS